MYVNFTIADDLQAVMANNNKKISLSRGLGRVDHTQTLSLSWEGRKTVSNRPAAQITIKIGSSNKQKQQQHNKITETTGIRRRNRNLKITNCHGPRLQFIYNKTTQVLTPC